MVIKYGQLEIVKIKRANGVIDIVPIVINRNGVFFGETFKESKIKNGSTNS